MKKLDLLKNKLFTIKQLKQTLNVWRFLDQKIVFTNGCFDLIHMGHIDYLVKASEFGNKLIIGLNSDYSVSKIKGNNRPISDQQSRVQILAGLFFVDAIILFDEDTPLTLIKEIQPDILVKGADYNLHQIVGADIVLKNGGQVKMVDYLPGYSTSAIENKIKNFK